MAGRASYAISLMVVASMAILQVFPAAASADPADDPSLPGGTIHTDHFDIVYQAGAANLAASLGELSEDVFADATAFMNFTPGWRIGITVNDTVEPFYDWISYWGGDYFGTMGYAIDERKITMLVPPGWSVESIGRVSLDSVSKTLAHEINHVLLRGTMPSQFSVLPRWFIEGLANYYAACYYEKTHGMSVPALPQYYSLVEAIEDGKLSGLDDITGWAYTEEEVGPAYVAGESVFDYIEAEYGSEAIHRFIDLFKGWSTGKTSNDNLDDITNAAFTVPRVTFENDWIDWLGESIVEEPKPGRLPDGARQMTNSTLTKVPTSWGRAGILYSDGSNGSLDIYLLNVTTMEVERLTDWSGTDADARFSPDGERITFSSKRDGTFDIYLMDADGSSVEQLTDDDCVNVAPCWFPDGQRLAFVSDKNGDYDIFEMRLDDRSVSELVVSEHNDGAPAISPDGETLAFCSDRSGDMGVCIMDLTTGDIDPPTENMHGALFPSWSPDGGRLAFIRENGDLVVHETHDGGMAVFVEDGYEHGVIRGAPLWSPDGSRLCCAIYSLREFTVWDVNIFTFESSMDESFDIEPYAIVGALITVATFSAVVAVKLRKRAKN